MTNKQLAPGRKKGIKPSSKLTSVYQKGRAITKKTVLKISFFFLPIELPFFPPVGVSKLISLAALPSTQISAMVI